MSITLGSNGDFLERTKKDQCGGVDCQRKKTRLLISSFMMQGRHFTLVLLKGPISSCTVRWMYTYILHICVMLNVKIERPIELRFDSTGIVLRKLTKFKC